VRDLQLDSVQMITWSSSWRTLPLCFEPGDEEGLATIGQIAARIAELKARGR
jgi:hypothetical protein